MTIAQTLEPLPVGVVVQGFSTSDFRDEVVADQCRELLARHGVVIYRDAHIAEAELGLFRQRIGIVGDSHPICPEPVSSQPNSTWVAPARPPSATTLWHTDGLTGALPLRPSLLTYPDVTGKYNAIEFADTCAAYDELPGAEKEEFEQHRVVHSLAAVQRLMDPRLGAEFRVAWHRDPAYEHPLVWKRRDGRRSLLIGATAGQVIGMSADAGWEMLASILNWATQPPFVLRHQWRAGDMVVWDNTALLHRILPAAN